MAEAPRLHGIAAGRGRYRPQLVAGGVHLRWVSAVYGGQQAVVILHGKLGIDGQINFVGIVLAGQDDGEFHALCRARHDGYVFGVLAGRQHLRQQCAELHLAPDAARFYIAEHALEIAHARGQALHFAQALIHLLQALIDQ